MDNRIEVNLKLRPEQIGKIKDMLTELKREKAMRKKVYPSFIFQGKLTKDDAELHNNRIDGAIKLLESIHEKAIHAKDGKQSKLFK
jgi:hypothetical protein